MSGCRCIMTDQTETEQPKEEKSEIELLRDEFNKKFDEIKSEREQEKVEYEKQLSEKDAAIADLKVEIGNQKDSIIKYQKALVRDTEGQPVQQDVSAPWTAAYEAAINKIFADLNFKNDKAKEEAKKLINLYRPW